MAVFYAFCGNIQQQVDQDERPMVERAYALQEWAHGLIHGFKNPTNLQRDVVRLIEFQELRVDLFLEIIESGIFDLYVNRMPTWEDLDQYLWKEASAVCIIASRLMGCRSAESERFAAEIGKAIQLTNIMRNISVDLRRRDRVYLPLQDLHQFGYSREDLANEVYDERFVAMMEFHAIRVENHFAEAALNLIEMDLRSLRVLRIMGDMHHNLLRRMRRDRFRVFDRRYRISPLRKLISQLKHL